MPLFTEKSLVEDYFVQKLQEKGWKFIPADDLERESLEEPLLTANLIRALRKLNVDINIGDEEINQVLNELKLKGTGIEGAKHILSFFKFGVPIKFEKERVVKYVKLFDYDNIENNEFIISRQVIHQNGDKEIRNDILLYISGIPLVSIECKNPASFTEDWYDAYKQIKDYEKTIPELYKYVQIGVAAEQTAKYFPVAPWQEEMKIHEWRDPQKDPIDSTIEMLTLDTLLSIIQNYLFFRVEYGSATKVVTRYMQYRVAEQIFNRVTNHIQGKEQKNKGLTWHWQGSGKTLTMIFAANKLYHIKPLENPTIFFVVDREELQEQLFQEFTALDITKPEIIDSIEALRKVLRHDEGRGKRGILITLIHKFRPEELHQLQKELETLSKNKETILTRQNVIAFIDEGHRTQYGTLAAQMRLILQKASFFAFTGTPISKRGRDTYLAFSYPPEEKYQDKYFITDSIQDGFTVKITYQPRLEKEAHLKKELLETFLEVEYEEIPEEFREKIEERVKQRLTTIKVILENPKRIKKVAEDIAAHFKENVDGKFKAIVVAVNRKACVHYKRALDQLLPREYSEIVMAFTRTDPQIIQDYLEELTVRYKGKEIEDIRKEIVDKFKEEDYPKILIVTDMLLTGFDAPILQTMYLDKPLKEHRLLQAIARTNRPYKGIKEAGLILDYVGILKEFYKAFEAYSKEDIKGVLADLNDLRKEFTRTLNETCDLFGAVPRDTYDRTTMLKAIEVLTIDEQNSKKFLENYKRLRKTFELLGPDIIKAQTFSEYKWLSAIYTYYILMVLRSRPDDERYVQKYFNKTLKYVYKTTELENIEKELPIIKFDEHYLKTLEEKANTKEEKAANIVFTLNRFILVDRQKNPVYESLTEKVERILKLWKERTKDFEKIYKDGLQIIEEISKLTDRQKELGFTDLEYSLLLTLENKFGSDPQLTKDIKELSNQLQQHMFKGWYSQQTARKNIEREVRRYMRKYIKTHGIKFNELEQLYQKIMENMKNYGQKS